MTSAAAPTPTDQAPTDQPPTPGVLVIDDSPLVHRLLKARLRDESIRLLHATDGGEGLDLLEQEAVAAVLLDLTMPELDGFEVLRRISENPGAKHVPIIVLSGAKDSQDKVMAFSLGAMDYITKPFDMAELRARLRSALRIHRLVTMLSERAHVDSLTGLWNRKHFDERLTQEVADNMRHGRPLSLAMLDLDHFKSINDNYGHPAGDAAIQGTADIIAEATRTGDTPCRYGGEELAIILPETTSEQAAVLCDRIREAVAERVWQAHPDRKITISIGVCGCDAASTASPEEWLEAADAALYQSKEGGRNRVTVKALPASDSPKLAAAG
ncbi:MAG: diguanylate cyclase [Planctomycetota bacterium]